MTITTGTRFGHYEVTAPLGKGGMGEVCLAEDTRLKRKVALKLLPSEFTFNAERLRRFELEAKTASGLNHPNIITIYDIGEAHNTHFIATEYIEGETLRERLRRKKLTLNETLDIALQIADALAAAHQAGIVHRDIKPENVMIRNDGIVKVLDFGLAKLTEVRNADFGMRNEEAETLVQAPQDNPQSPIPNPQSTDPGAVMGTPQYMSPEQARGQQVDARTDIFSFGTVLYEMLAGRPPFEGVNVVDVMAAILDREPPSLKSFLPDLPPTVAHELEHGVTKALRKDREQRWQHIKDLLIDLKECREELIVVARQTRTEQAQPTTSEPVPEASAPTQEAVAVNTQSSGKIILDEIKRHKLGVGVALTIIVAAVAGLGFGLYKLRWQNQAPSRAAGPAPRVVPFTSFPGNECCPSFSPDGNQIAYVWGGEKNDDGDIYVKLIDAGAPLRLTDSHGTAAAPSWSPDGRYLAFIRYAKEERGIFLVPVLGGEARLLYSTTTKDIVGINGPSWSPDGKLIAFSQGRLPQEPFRLFLLSVESQEVHPLPVASASKDYDYSPAFSPDGKTLAFARSTATGQTADIYLVPMTGGEPKRLTFDDRNVGSIVWTPDSREIIYASNRTGSYSLWRIPVTGGTPEQIAGSGNNVSSQALSRQGNRLAYVQYKNDSDIWRFDAKGQANRPPVPVKLISSTLLDVGPQYSADGQRIAFISDRTGNREVWVCQSDGTNPVQVTALGNPDTGTPRWSADGRQIAFDNITEGNRNIYVVGASGGNPRRLTSETSNEVRPSWSRDGKWVYFGSDRTGDWQVWKVPAEGGPAVQVTKQGGREAFESPDGKFVYYTKGMGLTSLWRIPTTGGEESQVLDQIVQGYWAVLEQGIFYLNAKNEARRTLEFFSFATTRATQLAVLEKEFEFGTPGFAVSPDGRWILLTQYEKSESDVMLMENFR